MEMTDWVIFFALVPFLLAIDLKLFNKGGDNVIGFRKSLILSGWYIIAGLAFGVLIWLHFGSERAMLYYTTYVIEKSLSLDNLFVMSVIFSAFSIPRVYQHRVLVWGIIGVVILRGIMIGAGAAIVHQFDWVLFIFAAILVYTGIRMMLVDDDDDVDDFEDKPLVIFLRKRFPLTKEIHGNRFMIKREQLSEDEKGAIKGTSKFVFTPLFLALIIIEISDVIFAVDSIPAALAVTTDPFIVFTSNVFAVLGLRALFFAVENIINRFDLMKYAISFVLAFIGFKVFYNAFCNMYELHDYHVTPSMSLIVTIGALTAGFIFSAIKTGGFTHDVEEEDEKNAENTQ
ncbi:MAG: TerC/Alx family metal homeostasis membrane protein [Alphaproteobacteria bacterium]